MKNNPYNGWHDLKREIISRWQEITENDILRIKNERRSIIDLLEKKVGMKFEEASQFFEEMAERFHLYDEPKYHEAPTTKAKKEKVLELSPKRPSDKDLKPKDEFHGG